jgi:nonribosomal peptide synthetase DhbF
LKAGAAYLPLDPDYPARRLALMLDDVEPVCVLTTGETAPTLPQTSRLLILDSPETIDALARCPRSNPGQTERARPLRPQHPAYIIYTSGSTGVPKGVVIPHRAIATHLFWIRHVYSLTNSDKILQMTNLSFDASMWELYPPLLSGGRLVVAPPGAQRDPEMILDLIKRYEITAIQAVPSFISELLKSEAISNCRGLRHVFAGGEALSKELVEEFYARTGAELHNTYGPTEATVDTTWGVCDRGDLSGVVSIGSPVWNTRVYVLDVNLRPAPVGIVGELYVGGVRLA